VFNVADSSITLGVLVLLLDVMIKERKEKKDREKLLETSEQAPVNTEAPETKLDIS